MAQGMTERISIHAPAQGATGSEVGTGRQIAISIHAPAQGATFSARMGDCEKHISIHAPAQGATGFCQSFKHKIFNFNPRPRAGGDWI